MIEPTTLPLATNYNKVNILAPHESADNSFNHDFAFPEASSMTKILTDFGNLNVSDENTLTDPLRVVGDHKNLQGIDDVVTLKAELEATRRKLAEYEARSKIGSQSSKPLKDDSSQSPYSSSPKRNLPRNETVWPEHQSSLPNAPPPPRPSPLQFPYSVPPLRIPSASLPFQIPNSDSNPISSNPI
jgi:hypothetical protein